jgi:Photosynthesis system II assembly factor YCF48
MNLFAVTNAGLVRLTPGDDAWTATLLRADERMQCVAVAPDDPETLYVGSRGHGVSKTTDGGATWTDTALPQPDVFSLAISPVDRSVYAGTEPSMLFKSTDGGGSWRELETLRQLRSAPTWSFPPRPWTSHVRWIAPNPADAGLLLVGIELGGLMRSTDGGETWADHAPGAQRDVHALAWHPRVAQRAYEAGGGGAAWSDDDGRTWQPADKGRDRHYTWALAVSPSDPDVWYVSASPGPSQAHVDGRADAYIYRWRSRGPWKPLGGGLPQPLDSMPYALLHTEDQLFAGLANGQIYVSRNAGDTWAPLPVRGAALRRLTALAFAGRR